MMQSVLAKLQDRPVYLFAFAFVFSFLFIPAFLYGAVSIWAVFFALILAFYFDRRLRNVLEKYVGLEQGKERCVASITSYCVVSAKLVVLMSAAPIAAMFAVNAVSVDAGLDKFVFPHLAVEAITRHSFDDAHMSLQIFNAFSVITVPFIVFVLLLSSTKFMQLSDRIMFLSSEDDPPGRRGHVQAIYRFYIGIGFLLVTFVPLIIKEALEAMLRTGIVPEFGILIFILSFSILISLFHVLLFIQIVAFKKS